MNSLSDVIDATIKARQDAEKRQHEKKLLSRIIKLKLRFLSCWCGIVRTIKKTEHGRK